MRFQGFSKETVDFLWGIRLNNDRAWYAEHKQECKDVLVTPMNALAQDVLEAVHAARPDLDFTVHMSRIYRDARRLYGHGPFRDYLWFSLHDAKLERWAGKPSFWFELGADSWSYGLGCWDSGASMMRKLRARINADPAPLRDLSEKLAAQDEFMLSGMRYKKMPAGLQHADLASWYGLRSLSISHEQAVGPVITNEAFGRRIAEGILFLLPFYDYLYPIGQDPDPILDSEE